MDPAFILTAAVVFWTAVLGGSAYAVRRFLRAYERRTGNETELAALRERVAAVEESLESVQGSLERLNASQEFTTKLLGARSTGERAP
jgi:membrane protein implicated in regulation of membrane protease activity